ncbi:6416_t:CDS:2 [Dentiscutata erythropus]|uniref:6416_t:CDS:1 n=1 Tax=Dentiscutata erythropus TaxID=1348616 RepID=A0A9N9GG73_9GLOM|nr:6416_t:CDS:2 [Dentiscutata erythropus]
MERQANNMGKYHDNHRTTKLIPITESIKLQENKSDLERIKQLTEQFEKMTVKSDVGNLTQYRTTDDGELEEVISDGESSHSHYSKDQYY